MLRKALTLAFAGAVAFGVFSILVLLTSPAWSDRRYCPDGEVCWVKPALKSSCNFWDTCNNSWHYREFYRDRAEAYRWRAHKRRTVIVYRDRNGTNATGADRQIGPVCQPRRRVVGDEYPSRLRALKNAERAWTGAVRYDFGERYQNLDRAKDVRHNCDPSSTSSILKRVHFRCALTATPCRATEQDRSEHNNRRYDRDEVDTDEK